MLCEIRKSLVKRLRMSDMGNRLYFFLRYRRDGSPKVDLEFPMLINIEVASVCNLRCIHCPSHKAMPGVESPRKLGVMSIDMFEKIMDEVDLYGKRRISLHKDGEPLLHKNIYEILARVKRNVGHWVYLTTNGILLKQEIVDSILDAGIDHVNISIGAHSRELYREIRGGDLDTVKKNVDLLMKRIRSSKWKPTVTAQIIELKGKSMKEEIQSFVKEWKAVGVVPVIQPELSWGVKHLGKKFPYRYPCYSLWESLIINSDGRVSACCMDWNQSLLIGDVLKNSIREIWRENALHNMRQKHIQNRFQGMDLCKSCNYWHLQPMLRIGADGGSPCPY
jgi:radical SAM protein with 4Fe4S-binding SPASM domain